MTTDLTNDAMAQDFLERQRLSMEQEFPPLTEQNTLLRQILIELQKTHPSDLAVCQLEFTNPAQILDTNADRCRVYFLNQGRRVKAQKIIISDNSTALTVYVGLEKPVITDAVGTGTGLRLADATRLEINAEVSWIELAINSAAAQGIPVNNSTPPTPTTGNIEVVAWTIPADAY